MKLLKGLKKLIKYTVLFLFLYFIGYFIWGSYFLTPAYFVEYGLKIVFVLVVFIIAKNKMKKWKRESEEREIVKAILSNPPKEMSVTRYHATRIFEFYGIDSIVGKTREEIEIVVKDYIHLYQIELNGFTENNIVNELIEF